MKIWKRIRQFARRRQFEQDLADEVQFHREMAGAAFGSAALAMEESREVWGFGWLDSLGQDVRYALRGFRKTPGFALTVVATIGLGLGLNSMLFTVFNAYVLRPIEVRDPYSLYRFTWTNQRGAGHAFSVPEYEQLRQSRTGFSDVLAYDNIFGALEGHSMLGQTVSANYFSMLGAGTFLGRPLLPGDMGVIVISHVTWKELGADPEIVGKRLYLRGEPVEVAGVANPGFAGLEDFPAGYWIPLAMSSQVGTQTGRSINLVGRLLPGTTADTAGAGLLVWARQASADLPDAQKAAGVLIESNASMVPLSRDAFFSMMPVFVAFGLVLLIACVNVSNMMLARALARQREIGIRVSVGAGRARLIRQLLTESLLLAIPSAAAGFAVSKLTLDLALRVLFATMPAEFGKVLRVIDLSPDIRVLGFILMASLGATLLFGLVPAIQTTRSRLVEANRGDFSSDFRPTRLRNALVVTQVAVCTLLLVCAGVVLRGRMRVDALNFGIDVRGVFDLKLPEKYHEKAAALLAAHPGVESVAAVWHPPLYGPMKRVAVQPAGSRATVLAGYNFVSPEYFPLFRIPMVRGRNFSAEETRSEAAVIVVSETAAQRLFPNSEALGQSLAIQSERGQDPYYGRQPTLRSATVIGIVRDVTNGWSDNGNDKDCVYFPTNSRARFNDSLLVRASGRKAIEEALERIAPSVADVINPMEEVLAGQSYPFRISFWVSGALGALALALTISGIYGVLSYLVSQRTREIGIRVALGADAAGIVGLVMKQSMRLAAIGTAIGVALALAVAPLFAHAVTALNPYEGTAYAGCALLVMLAAVGAAFSPSRRAAGIDPAITLRGD